MTIISSISTALEKVQFSSTFNTLPFPPTGFAYLEPFFHNYQNVASTAAAVLVILATSYHVYTNVLDLDKPKGYRDIPKLNSWKILYYQFRSLPSNIKYNHSMKDVHEKYGISRLNHFGVRTVHLASPEYAHQMLMNTDVFPKFDLSLTQPDSFLARFLGYNIVQSNDDMWRRHRRICNPAFHKSWSTDVFGERTDATINKILGRINHGDHAVNVDDMTKRMTLDALGKVAFDHDFKSIEDANDHFSSLYHTLLDSLVSPLYVVFPALENFPFFRRPETQKALKLFNELLFGIIDAKREKLRLAAESGLEFDDKDLLSLMIKANQDGKLSDEELRANVLVFVIAGHDTTANSLSCAFYYLAKNPEVQERLHAEITAVLGPSDASNGTPVPTVDESKDMELLNAIIKETMRLDPSVEMLPARVVATETTMGPYILPVGTLLVVNINSIHRNPKYWDHPDDFNPDRFINMPTDHKDNVKSGKKDPSAWLPFSSGSRTCLGINFSLIEQRVALIMLIHRFKVSLPADSPHKDGINFRINSLKSPEDLYIHFSPRY